MIVQCTSCGTRFRLGDDKIGPDGARVRCSRCQASFTVDPPQPPQPVAPASRLDPAAFDFEHSSQTRVTRIPEVARRPAPPPDAVGIETTDEVEDLPLADDDLVQSLEETRDAPVEPPDPLAASGGLELDGTYVAPEATAPAPAQRQITGGGADLDLAAVRAPARQATVRATGYPRARVTNARQSLTGGRARQGTPYRPPRIPGLGVLGLIGIVGGTLFWMQRGPNVRMLPGWQWLTTPEDRIPDAELVPYGQVTPVGMRSLLYPTSAGQWVLVFIGEAENRGPAVEEGIDVIAEVVDPSGRTLATGRGPLGVTLGPAELAPVRSADDLTQLYDTKVAAVHGDRAVARGAKLGYTVVVLRPPGNLKSVIHRVRLVPGERRMVATPEPQPPPETLDEPTERPNKGKRKAKLKGKQRLRGRKSLPGSEVDPT